MQVKEKVIHVSPFQPVYRKVHIYTPLSPVVCSLVGHTASQHLGDWDNFGPLPSCKPWVFINKKPGKSAALLPCSAFYCKYELETASWLLYLSLGSTEAGKVQRTWICYFSHWHIEWCQTQTTREFSLQPERLVSSTFPICLITIRISFQEQDKNWLL